MEKEINAETFLIATGKSEKERNKNVKLLTEFHTGKRNNIRAKFNLLRSKKTNEISVSACHNLRLITN